MKNLIGILLFIVVISSCLKGQSKNLSTIEELREFFDLELEKFNRINHDTSIQVKKIVTIGKHFHNSPNFNKSQINLQNLDWYNIERKLLLPFKKGIISEDQFIHVIDTLNINLAEYIPLYFQKYRFKQLETNDKLLNRVLLLSKNYNQTKGYLIRATQRPNKSKHEIIDSLKSDYFYKSRHPEIDVLISRYAELGNDKETLDLLEYAIGKLEKGTRLNWNPAGDAINVFEQLLKSDNSETKSAALLLIYRFLDKSETSEAYQFHYLLSQEISDDIKKLMNSKLEMQNTLSTPEELRKEEKSFFGNYLSSYAINYRLDAIPLIKKAISLDSSKLRFDENGINYKIIDYQDEVIVRYGVQALLSMSKLYDLNEIEKNEIFDTFIQSNLLKAKGYFWRDAVGLIENLYPYSKYEDYKEIFLNVPESSRYTSIEDYWNRNKFSTSELKNYLDFFGSINIDTSQITEDGYYNFEKKYRNNDRETVIWGVFELLGISFNYDRETGVWPNPYDDLINKYLELTKDLNKFYPVIGYEKIGANFKTFYKTAIFNGKYGYLTYPKDYGDWYDPITIETMLNIALEGEGSKKRFIQIESGDQTILTLLAEPGQVKKIIEKFKLKLVNEY